MDEGLKALLQAIALLTLAGFCVFMAVSTMRRNKANQAAEYEAKMLKLRKEAESRLAANAHQFSEPEVADMFLRAGLCTGPLVESLINGGYKSLESVAHADIDAIKKLPKFGPKSAPATINAARKKMGLPPLS